MTAESESSSPPSKRRRRFVWLGVATGLLVMLSAAAALRVYFALSGEDALLGRREWSRLLARWSREETAEAGPTAPVSSSSSKLADPRPPSRLPVEVLPPDVLEIQSEAYEAVRPKTVLELQPFRRTERMETSGAGGLTGNALLVNLNPTVNRWYLLLLQWSDGKEGAYHLANARPKTQDLTLDPGFPHGITIVNDRGSRRCEIWSERAPLPLALAETTRSPYTSLCGDELTLRLRTEGRRTTLEWATDFLRDNVWGGERITVFVREKFFQDAYLSTSEAVRGEGTEGPLGASARSGPRPAKLHPASEDTLLVPAELGLSLDAAPDGGVVAGKWHPSRHHEGVYVSVVRADLLDREILASHRNVVSALDAVEKEALTYLVAFDLSRFDVGFALGTEHPRVSWSARVPDSVRDPALAGPDGIGEVAPLVATGIVPHSDAHRTVATFTGGFKRDHGAFRVSELAGRNQGSHYGFIESGAILSKLQPGLATLFALEDGRVEMKTWREEDDALLPRIDFARQNGLPIVEPDPATGLPVPGARVSQWAAGNWSGSQDRSFRTVRAGAALQDGEEGRFLIYAYFSSATPSAMARVFQAYGCEYAMLLDMNALEHTYAALYHVEDGGLAVEHLVRGMEVLDKSIDGQVLPRFLGFADNRDFFYVTRREEENADM